MASSPTIHRSRFADLSTQDLYDILRLRSDVFVVEQHCVFLDLDGRDDQPSTEHLWIRDEVGVAATLRLLEEDDGVWSIGRVVARADVRGSGVAIALMHQGIEILESFDARSIVIGAQAHLSDWYARFGFTVSGPEYDEDGIQHVPMVRSA